MLESDLISVIYFYIAELETSCRKIVWFDEIGSQNFLLQMTLKASSVLCEFCNKDMCAVCETSVDGYKLIKAGTGSDGAGVKYPANITFLLTVSTWICSTFH